MALRSNLVNRQYNTPINLYSQENVQETLQKQTQVLANGAVGINFHNLAKPGNLANSAVLRMLEEEERSGRGQGLKRVAWPPPPSEENELSTAPEEVDLQQPVYSQGPTGVREPTPTFRQAPQSPKTGRKADQGFQPVYFEPPRATVTLRETPPLRQESAPVYAASPATVSVQGGQRMRGDQKWPPESVKQQAQAENAARIALAKGPACRPRRVNKDYSSFFAQHALNPTYPGYKAPPGTQHYTEDHGTSNF